MELRSLVHGHPGISSFLFSLFPRFLVIECSSIVLIDLYQGYLHFHVSDVEVGAFQRLTIIATCNELCVCSCHLILGL